MVKIYHTPLLEYSIGFNGNMIYIDCQYNVSSETFGKQLSVGVSAHAELTMPSYRLGNFKDPRNLMLGVGFRL